MQQVAVLSRLVTLCNHRVAIYLLIVVCTIIGKKYREIYGGGGEFLSNNRLLLFWLNTVEMFKHSDSFGELDVLIGASEDL